MIRITVDGKVYDYDRARLMLSEAKVMQRFTGLKMSEFEEAVGEENLDAVAALVWLVRFRAGESDLKPEDVEFDFGTLTMEDADAKAEELELGDAVDFSKQSPDDESPPSTDES